MRGQTWRTLRVAVAGLLFAGPVLAQGMGGGRGEMTPPPLREPPTGAELGAALGLDPAQVARFEALRAAHLADAAPLRQRAEALRATMMQARQAGVAEDSLVSLRQQMQPIMMALMQKRQGFRRQLGDVLTGEQLAAYDARFAPAMGMMRGRGPGAGPPAADTGHRH